METTQSTFWPRCPTCDMVVEPQKAGKFLPFCSPRCSMVDLGRWLNEEHALSCNPADEAAEDEGGPAPGPVALPPGWHDA